MCNKAGGTAARHYYKNEMKKANEIKPVEMFADRIRQTLTAKVVPTYDWMYELGLNASQLGVYAYIFNVCKSEPMKAHHIKTQELAQTFGVTVSNISYVIDKLVKAKLIGKHIEGKGNLQKPYYSLYQPA